MRTFNESGKERRRRDVRGAKIGDNGGESGIGKSLGGPSEVGDGGHEQLLGFSSPRTARV